MKKTLLLSCAVALMPVCSTAQISVGPAVGFHVTSYTTMYADGSKQSTNGEKKVLDMQAGAVADLPFSHWLHVQSGLIFTTNSYKYEGPVTPMGQYSFYYNIRSLELPVNITLYTGIKDHGQLFFSAGAFLSCNVSGRRHTRNVWTTTDSSIYGVTETTHVRETEELLKFGKKPGDNANNEYDYRRLGGGVDFNVGYQHKSGIFARVHYQKGLRNQNEFSSPKTTSSNFGLTIGCLFPAKSNKQRINNKEQS